MSQLNDPRVFFAAERTLLAWNRTSLTLMAFGFVIERSGLLLRVLAPQSGISGVGGSSFWIGVLFIVLGAGTAGTASVQKSAGVYNQPPAESTDG